MGILHDVSIRVADFILSVDFVVQDCEGNFKVPIIVGRPFLVVGQVIVDMEMSELKFRLNNKETRFIMHSPMTQQKVMSVFSIVDVFYEDGKEVSAGCLGKV